MAFVWLLVLTLLKAARLAVGLDKETGLARLPDLLHSVRRCDRLRAWQCELRQFDVLQHSQAH